MANRNSATPAGDKPRLTEEEKKQNHINSEKKRRTAIRDQFNRLSDIVPGMEGKGRSEALVLESTVAEINHQIAIMEQMKAKAISNGQMSDAEFNAHYDPKNQPANFTAHPPSQPLQLDRGGQLTRTAGPVQAPNGYFGGMQQGAQYTGGLPRAQPPMPGRRRSSSRSSAGSATMVLPMAPASRPTSRGSNISNMPPPAHPASRPGSRGSNDGTPISQRPGSRGSNGGLPTNFPMSSQPMMQQDMGQVMVQFPGQEPMMMGFMSPQQMQPSNMQHGGMPYGSMQYPNMYQLGGMQPSMQQYGMASPASMQRAGSFDDGERGYTGYPVPYQMPSQRNGNQDVKPETSNTFGGLPSSRRSVAENNDLPAELSQRQQRLNVMPSTPAQWRKTDERLKAEQNGEGGEDGA